MPTVNGPELYSLQFYSFAAREKKSPSSELKKNSSTITYFLPYNWNNT